MAEDLEALIVFALVGSGTPGPNNSLLLASGLQFGFRRTLAHVVGTSIGLGSLTVAVAAGVGVIVATVPALDLGLRIAGSLYLLVLAFQLAVSRALAGSRIARPLRLGQAVLFQFLNPKAWLFALAAMSAFRPGGLPVVLSAAVVVAVIAVVVLATAALWAAGGSVLHRLTVDERTQRPLRIALAVLLVASVAFMWV